jgi:hypothetical protein
MVRFFDVRLLSLYRCFSRRRPSTERPTRAVPNNRNAGGNGFAKLGTEAPDSWSCCIRPSATSTMAVFESPPMAGIGGSTGTLSGGEFVATWVGTLAPGPSGRSGLNRRPIATGTVNVLVVGLESPTHSSHVAEYGLRFFVFLPAAAFVGACSAGVGSGRELCRVNWVD